MNYTDIPTEFKEEYYEKFRYGTKENPFKEDLARQDPVIFAYYKLGKRLRLYQAYAVKQFLENRYNIWCWGRRLGKSLTIAVIALWAMYYNKLPTGIHNNTICLIVSQTYDASIKIIDDINNLIIAGDLWNERVTEGKLRQLFTSKLKGTNNKEQITMNINNKPCFVKAYPPTDRVKGNAASLIFVDEAAHLDNTDPRKFFDETVAPVISDNDKSKILITSTPNGKAGLFYELFDPDNIQEINYYNKIWYGYSIHDDEDYQIQAELDKKIYLNNGKQREWEQEREASFTSADGSFFDPKDVDEMIDSNLIQHLSSSVPVDIGVDFGGQSISHTAVTVSTQDKEGIIYRLFHKVYPIKEDFDLLYDLDVLKTNFPNTMNIIVDDCLENSTLVTTVTESGYKPVEISKLIPGDKVLGYDFDKKEYVINTVLQSLDKGKQEVNVIKLRNGTELKATNGHRFFHTSKNSEQVREKKFSELKETDKLTYARSIPSNGLKVNRDLAYLYGIYIAEGSHHVGENRCFIAQSKEKNNLTYTKIKTVLDNLNIRYSEFHNGFSLLSKQRIVGKLQSFGTHCHNKQLPEEVYSWSNESLQRLFEGLIDGDGSHISERKDKRGYRQSELITYTTTSKVLASQLLFLGRQIGLNFYISIRDRENKLRSYNLRHNENSWFNKKYSDTNISKLGFSINRKELAETWDISVTGNESFVLWDSGLVVHNCPAGWHLIQKMEEKGWQLIRMNYRAEKLKKYGQFRAKLHKKQIKSYRDDYLLKEMYGLNNECKAMKGYTDDSIDSFMMSCYNFIEEEKRFNFYDLDEVEVDIDYNGKKATTMGRETPFQRINRRRTYGYDGYLL